MDRVKSSYAPSLRLLAHLNSGTIGPGVVQDPPRLLAVGLSDTPGERALPEVRRELAAVSEVLPEDQVTVLSDEQATVSAVLDALPRHDWLHFACHGRQYARDPSYAKLCLHDGPLSVRDLRGVDLRRNRLAVLSACQTAMSGTTLMNEGLHLGAAMHVAGCREVVGTLWAVGDSSTAQVVKNLYGHLSHGGALDVGRVATALHDAVRELRAEAPDLCSAWAPFVHIGASR
jgi:CHAT domain-containing protein